MHPSPVRLRDIPNPRHLVPDQPHDSHTLFDNLLLCRSAVFDADSDTHASCTICTKCLSALSKNTRPSNALSRGYWFGDIPDEIACLNAAELHLIQLRFPRVYLVKMQMKRRNGSGARVKLPYDQMMDGMRGSVSSVHMPTSDAVKMLEGSLAERPRLPNPTWVLGHTILIAFLGLGKHAPYYLQGLFKVRLRCVIHALARLRQINPLYKNFEWNKEVLSLLPSEDVPSSIVARDKPDKKLERMAAAEGVGYMTEDVGDGDPDADKPDDGEDVPINLSDDMRPIRTV